MVQASQRGCGAAAAAEAPHRWAAGSVYLKSIVVTVSAFLFSACATPGPSAKLDSAFSGVWRNEVLAFNNWWVITPDSAVNYGTSTGTCARHEAEILDSKRIRVVFGNSGTVDLELSKDKLLFHDLQGGGSTHIRVFATTICARPGGYHQRAPYPQN